MSNFSGKHILGLITGMAVLAVGIMIVIAVSGGGSGSDVVEGGPDTWDAPTREYVEAQRTLAENDFKVRKYESARQTLTELLARYPAYAEGQSWLASIIYAQGDMEGAYAQMLKAVAIDPGRANDQLFAGQVAMKLGKPEEAKEHYTAALQTSPSDPRFVIALAHVNVILHNTDDAQMLALKALQLNADVHQAHAILAGIAAGKGKLDMAVDQMDKAIAIAQAAKPSAIRLYTIQKAEYLRRDNQPELALAALTELTASGSAHPKVIEAMAQCHLQMSQPAEAGRLWSQLLAGDPTNVEAAAEAGLCYHRAGDDSKARQLLTIAQRLYAEHPKTKALAKALGQ